METLSQSAKEWTESLPEVDLTVTVAPTAESRVKRSEGNSLWPCFSIRFPPTVPVLRTFVLATYVFVKCFDEF